MHHDFFRLANGNTLVLSAEQAVDSNVSDKEIHDDVVYEITPNKKKVWVWRNREHIDELGLDEAAAFYRQAADIRVELKDVFREGGNRNNLAHILIKLRRYDEARSELHRAIQCDKPFGHAASPWTAWQLMHELERAAGNLPAAAEARQEAISLFLAYRRAGGENQSGGGRQCAIVAEAIAQRETEAAEQLLAPLADHPEAPASLKVLTTKLLAILDGERDPVLADDPNLRYDDAAELQLLLERL